jgi:protoporphyrinogen oxidase
MTVTGIETENGRAAAVRAQDSSGEIRFRANHILSTIPLSSLPCLIEPSAPTAILESSRALKFRAMLLIYLVLETVQFTEFDAHYFPGPEIAITRLSEPKNYSLNGPAGSTVLCAELPCFPEDAVWSAPDAELGALVAEALAAAGLPVRVPIREVAVRRLKQAYPVYTRNYREHFDRIDGWLNSFEGILTFGLQGLFAHDNTHHALAMAYAADSCLDDSGNLNRVRWAEHRRAFEHHVVED